MARIGRPQKPHVARDGTIVPGLYHCADGRWLVKSTGKKFTEEDERLAIARFRAMMPQPPTVTLNLETVTQEQLEAEGSPALATAIDSTVEADGRISFIQKIPEAKLWEWMREQLIVRPDVAARMTGIPQLASIASLPVPKHALSLATILDAYMTHSGSKPATLSQTRNIWARFINHTSASALDHVTTEKLVAYRQFIESSILSPATRKYHYSKIKTVLGFGSKVGMDPAQIRDVLDRAKVLWTAERKAAPKPAPITREEFHALLTATRSHPWQSWRPWLLVGLNFAMHSGEVCRLKWSELDLDAGTYVTIRAKTEAHRIPRAACIWPETLEALKTVPRKSEWVFTSSHGRYYNRNTRANAFKKFKDAAGLPHLIFDSLRDGAYSAACLLCPDERWARLLAGHRSPGLQDNYVLRNPAIVKPACDAVYAAYGPFPTPE